jgi:hypothetical protein
MMLKILRYELKNIPLLIYYDDGIPSTAIKTCILFYHGFKGSKESNQRELESLASHGYLAVGVDALGHGARRYADFEQRFSADSPSTDREFIHVVNRTATEVPFIVDHLTREYSIGRLGVAGISMGGFITYAAILHEPRIKTAVSILGSPHWVADPMHSPDHFIEKFSSVHLLSMNAGKDAWVPSHYARDFHIVLGEHFADYAKRFNFVEYPNSGHFMDDADWKLCWARALNWFEGHISTSIT